MAGGRTAGGIGSFDRWEELFRLTGIGVAGGSGWAILAYDYTRQEIGRGPAQVNQRRRWS
jgi:superoxide dismutase